MADLSIFKAYDIRGTYPKQIDEETAYLIGGALVESLSCKNVAIARDNRLSSESLQRALVKGITDAGADAYIHGILPTDGLYFAVGKFEFDAGIMITASHNPPEYNGFKICTKSAVPLSGDYGLPQIKNIVAFGRFRKAQKPGSVFLKNVLDEYITHCLKFINVSRLESFDIAIDAGNGVAGVVLPSLLNKLPFKTIPMFFEPDGNFPNHIPSPIEPKNTEALREKVVNEKLDFGVAFDGDADRMFIIDDTGRTISGDIATAMVSQKILSRFPRSAIVYNIICSKIVPETINRYGGTPIRSRVGHAFIKPLMRQHNAVFGGEHSGHFYFRDHWYADSGIIAFLVIAELFSETQKKPSELVAEMNKYYRTGEINKYVADREKSIKFVANIIEQETGIKPDTSDGITFEFDDFWFNLRPSNTEPLLRLNLEANSRELMEQKRDWILKILEKF